MLKLSIKKQIWVSILLVTTLTSLLLIILTFYMYEKLYIEKQINSLQLQGSNLQKAYYESGNDDSFQKHLIWLDKSQEASIIFTNDPMFLAGGSPIQMFEGENLISFEERQKLLNGEVVQLIRPHEHLNQEILAVVFPLLDKEGLTGAIFLYLPLEAITEVFQPLRLLIYSGVPIFLVFVIFVGYYVSRYVTKPIIELKNVTEKMAEGDYTNRISIRGGDELSSLARSINKLSSSLERVENERKAFLGNVSHELRTPLSYVKGFTEGYEEGLIKKEKFITTIHNEITRMERLVHDLLDLAQLEGDTYPMKEQPIVLSQLIVDVLERVKHMADEKQILFSAKLNEDVIVLGDIDRLEQVISNILLNAIRYSPKQRAVHIKLVSEKDHAKLIIRDEGIGIPLEDLPYVTERFYRVDKARTRKDGGTGLGLSIVQQIINKHNGTLNIESKVDEGTVVIITLPLLELK